MIGFTNARSSSAAKSVSLGDEIVKVSESADKEADKDTSQNDSDEK